MKTYIDNLDVDIEYVINEKLKRSPRCNKCILRHDDYICFFAYDCITKNFYHFKAKEIIK